MIPHSLQVSAVVRLFLALWLAITPTFAWAGSMTLLGVGGPAAAGCSPILMLDCITTGIKAAYSTRKILTSYAGSAMRVQRASDSTQLDIGFAAGVLDYAAITTFGAGTSVAVTTWYDQSGGGFNLTQSTFANMFLIYESGGGVSKFINTTRPAPFNGGLGSMSNASLAQNPVNTLYMNAVAAISAAAALVGGTVNNNTLWDLNGSPLDQRLLASQIAVLGTSNIAGTASGSVFEVQYNASTGAGSFWIDAAAAGTFTTAHTMAGGGVITVGSDISAGGSGNLGELVMYDLVGGIPSGSRTTIEANQKAYWGTP